MTRMSKRDRQAIEYNAEVAKEQARAIKQPPDELIAELAECLQFYVDDEGTPEPASYYGMAQNKAREVLNRVRIRQETRAAMRKELEEFVDKLKKADDEQTPPSSD